MSQETNGSHIRLANWIEQIENDNINDEQRQLALKEIFKRESIAELGDILEWISQYPRNYHHFPLVRDLIIQRSIDDTSKQIILKQVDDLQWYKNPYIGFLSHQIIQFVGGIPSEKIIERLQRDKHTLLRSIELNTAELSDAIALCDPRYKLSTKELLTVLEGFNNNFPSWRAPWWGYLLAGVGLNEVKEINNALRSKNGFYISTVLSALEYIRNPINVEPLAPHLVCDDRHIREHVIFLLRDLGGEKAVPLLYNYVDKQCWHIEKYEIGHVIVALATLGDKGIAALNKLVTHECPKIYEALNDNIEVFRRREEEIERLKALFPKASESDDGVFM